MSQSQNSPQRMSLHERFQQHLRRDSQAKHGPEIFLRIERGFLVITVRSPISIFEPRDT
jgi:hypothetical protein